MDKLVIMCQSKASSSSGGDKKVLNFPYRYMNRIELWMMIIETTKMMSRILGIFENLEKLKDQH